MKITFEFNDFCRLLIKIRTASEGSAVQYVYNEIMGVFDSLNKIKGSPIRISELTFDQRGEIIKKVNEISSESRKFIEYVFDKYEKAELFHNLEQKEEDEILAIMKEMKTKYKLIK